MLTLQLSLLLTFSLHLLLITCDSNIAIGEELMEESMDDSWTTNIKTFFEEFYKGQKFVNVLHYNSNYSCGIFNILSNVRPLFHYRNSMEAFNLGKSFLPPPTSYGYFSYVRDSNALDFVFMEMKKINPNAHWVLTVVEKGKDIGIKLELAWKKYKILNLMIFESETFTASFYHPFVISGGRRGKVYDFSLFAGNETETMLQLFTKRNRNLYGYRIPINIFETVMFSKPIKRADGSIEKYILRDGEILHDLSFAMNFTLEFIDVDFSKRGNITVNLFHFNWLLNALETEQIDYSAMYRVMVDLNTTNVAFLQPFTTAKGFCVVQNRPSLSHIGTYVFGFFSATALLVDIVANLLTIAVMQVGDIVINQTSDPVLHVLNLNGMLCGVSINYSTRAGHQLILMGVTLFAFIIFGNTFQGTIVSQLSTPNVDANIQTIQELVDSDTVLEAVNTFFNLLKPEEGDNASLSVRLYQKLKLGDDNTHTTTAKLIAKGRLPKNEGFLTRSGFAFYLRALHYDPRTGDEVFHIVPESPVSFYLSSSVPKTSPYIDIFNENLLRISEAGLIQKALIDENIEIYLIYIKRTRKRHVSGELKPIRLENLKNVFKLYCLMISLTVIAFILEIVHHKFF